jgi:CubicO group peptidase (beta-lactamase class C family)
MMTNQETMALQLADLVDRAGFAPDAVLAVVTVNRDGTLDRHARGALPDGRAMSTSTLVYGASQTKQIIALCAARLVQARRLDPEAPLATWFPDWPAWARQVRFRHLVHHLSGMPNEDVLLARMAELGFERRTSDAMLSAVATFPDLQSAPGETYAYSNIGYVTMSRIIEHIAGAPLAEHVHSVVFEPLAMEHSLLWAGSDAYPAGANPLDPAQPTPHSLGDGGMWTTADDFSRWIRAMNADRFGVRDLMMTTTTMNDGTPHDYAWAVRVSDEYGHLVCSHGGAWWGSVSKSAWLPTRGSGFIAFTVAGGEPLDALSTALVERLTGGA